MPEDPHNNYDRHSGPRDRSMRVGDAEREAVGEILRREHVKGRLDAIEFQERLERSLDAKTYADLDVLIADLPGNEPTRRGRPRTWTRRPWPFGLVPLVVIGVILATGGHALWLAFPLFAFLVLRPLVCGSWGRGYRGYGRW
jgi:hypothetical protein